MNQIVLWFLYIVLAILVIFALHLLLNIAEFKLKQYKSNKRIKKHMEG